MELKLYQQFKLSASDARAVQDKIYVLEAKAGMAAKKQAAEQKAAAAAIAAEKQKQRDYQAKIGFLAGAWKFSRTTRGGGIKQQDSDPAVITITDKTVLIYRIYEGRKVQQLKGTIEGDDSNSIKGILQGYRAPDYPIDVTVDKDGRQIHWKAPTSLVGRIENSWTWQLSVDVQLTR